jgi:hypothetical protein
LFSFPRQLALDRSNIDVLIFLLLLFLGAVLASWRVWAVPLAAALAWMVVAIKVYPLVGIVAWVGQSLLWRPRLDWLRGATLAGALAGLASAFSWLLHQGKGAAQPAAGVISHGLRVPLPASPEPMAYSAIFSIIQPLLGLALFMLAISYSFRADLSGQWMRMLDRKSVGFERRFLQTFPALLGSVWLGCFFFSSSFDYRLILVFPAYVSCFSLWACMPQEDGRTRLLLKVVIYGSFLAFLGPLLLTSGLLRPPFVLIEVLLDKLCDLIVLPLLAGVVASLMIPSMSATLWKSL